MKPILLQNKEISLRLLTTGAKLVSLVFRKNEILYTKTLSRYNPGPGSVFNEKYAWGADICFPSVKETVIKPNGKTYSIADHGNFWTKRFMVIKKTKNSISLHANDKFFLLKVSFTLRGNELIRTYAIKNLSSTTLPYIFADHFLLPVNRKLPPFKYLGIPCKGKMSVEYSFENKLGGKGQKVDWAIVRKRPFADKLFGELTKRKNGLYNFSYEKFIKDSKLRLNFSSPDLPFVGYWHTEGGWKGEFNLGLEFTNGTADELSLNSFPTLGAGAREQFSITLELE